MIQNTISREAARRYYDRLGTYHDWAERFEGRAKACALTLLDLTPGTQVLNVGVGTGKEQAQLASALAPDGVAVGLDVSPVMLHLARSRTRTPVCLGDVRRLPFVSASFDCLFAAYVLDLLPAQDLPNLLHDFRRVLAPGGRLALVTLTEGVTLPSRALVALWKMAYAISPEVCGGCRPLRLACLVEHAGLRLATRDVVVQWGVPSEVIVAIRH
ncbi:MAG: hypothetical protein CL878_10440 [Dehalococcoidia bacterium]|nr:hypothetical protein [Dehalococcoidia bacterium]